MPVSKLQIFRNVLMSKTAKMTLLIFCLFVLYKVFIQSDSKSFIRDKRKDSKFEFILSLFKKKTKIILPIWTQ